MGELVPHTRKGREGEQALEAAHAEALEEQVYLIRDRKVMLDTDVAKMYEVESKRLIQVVRRNPERFPVDFVFRLTPDEFKQLKEQLQAQEAPQYKDFERNHSTPYAFTEEGVVMAAHYLKSPRAIHVGNTVVQDFIRLRRLCGTNMEISHRLETMEEKYDQQFREVFQALKTLESAHKPPAARQVGFRFT